MKAREEESRVVREASRGLAEMNEDGPDMEAVASRSNSSEGGREVAAR